MTTPKKPKRQRVDSPAGPVKPATDTKHKRFTTWVKARGVDIQGVLPQSLEGRGLGLVTVRPFKAGERILFVPEGAIFKPDFAVLRQKNLDRISSQAKLAVSALFHFAQKDSPVEAWLQTWPTVADFKACMPMYWDRSVINRLPPASRSVLDRQLVDYDCDWLACRTAVEQAGHSEDEFKYYWMIVNSRSFHWSPPRGSAGYMVMCPFIDYTNHGPTGTGCEVAQRSDGYEMLAQRNYSEEILFSYGAHSNDKLLVHYGFLLQSGKVPPSVDDEIRIDEVVMQQLSPSVKEQLSDVGYLGPFALVPRMLEGNRYDGCEPCFKTQVAIRATMLTCNEWEYFASNGEDLSGDNTDDVNQVLASAAKAMLDRAEANSQPGAYDTTCPANMTEEDYQSACTTVRLRWEQAACALREFSKPWTHGG